MSAVDKELEQLLRTVEGKKRLRAAKLPDEAAAIAQMQEAYTRLEELGFRSIAYCPKDGTAFEAIEAGAGGIMSDCFYMGDWPDGGWCSAADGDLWPVRPCLFRLKPPGEIPPCKD